MGADTRGIRDGFQEETRSVAALTSRVAGTTEGWNRGGNLSVPGTETVSEIYADRSVLLATYGALAQKDTGDFDEFGVSTEVQDAQVCEAPQ